MKLFWILQNITELQLFQPELINPKNVAVLLKQEYIKDSSKTIEILVKETIAKLGENIVIKRFQRFEIGE